MKQKFLITAMLITFIFAGCAFADDIDLGEGYHVPSGFSSILITSSDGTAICNAVNRIQEGGTILLSGTFKLKKQINIKKNLTIKGQGTTILDGTAANDRVIRCEGNITLENLTITGGDSSNGGGVKLDGGEVNIISCDITGNKAELGGGGIHSSAYKLTITKCNISNNESSFAGGGISALFGTITINDSTISGNTAKTTGGGIGVLATNIILNNSTVTKNTAEAKGGGIVLIISASCTATNSSITGNTAPESADILVDASSSYTNS